MHLQREEVLKIAHLARLALSEEEITRFARDLTNILEFNKKLEEVDTSNITPFSHPLEGLSQRLRDDEASESNQRRLFQNLAPKVAAGLYLVPKVIENLSSDDERSR